MNVRMWEHEATRTNLATLKTRGVMTVGPNEGDMACGEYGFGRMAEPHEILAAIEAALKLPRALSGLRALVTSGPTHEDRKSTRLTPVTNAHLVCRLLLEKKKKDTRRTTQRQTTY